MSKSRQLSQRPVASARCQPFRRASLLCVLVVLAGAGIARGADIFVTATVDGIANDGNCTLREAIRAANLDVAVDTCAAGEAAPAVDVVVLAETSSAYRLTVTGVDDDSGDLDVFTPLDIVGAPSTIDATGLGDRVLDIRAGAGVTLIRVSLRGGDAGAFQGGGVQVGSAAQLLAFGGSFRGNRAALGSGIAVGGGATATLHDSDVSANGASHAIRVSSATLEIVDTTVADNDGAGISAVASNVTIESSSIWGNTMTGLQAAGSSILTVRNSTISDNGGPVNQRGGGLLVEAPAAATLYYVTVAGNQAEVGGGVNVTGSLTLKASILGDNLATSSHPDCYGESATLTSLGFNLVHRNDCGLVMLGSDRVDSAPALDALADWDGPTRTRRLLPGSPALDGADPADFPLWDERGEGRPRNGDLDALARPDIGAHENGNTITVDVGTDQGSADGFCSLRDALRSANTDTAVDGCRAGFERDLIWIDSAVVGDSSLLLVGEDDLSAVGDLDVLEDVDVAGLPQRWATIDGNSIDRVFEVHAPALLGLSHLVVKDGVGFLVSGGALRIAAGAAATLFDVAVDSNTAAAQAGGGALVEGELVGEAVWFRDNTAADAGGAISVVGDDARLLLRRATITGNKSTQGDGGGIAVADGTARLDDVTLADNQAAGDGGGLHNAGTVELRNATIAYNRADFDGAGGGAGGGVHSVAGTTRTWNSLVAKNLGPTPDCAGTLLSGGYNLIGVVGCAFAATTGDQTGIDPGLGALVAGMAPLLAGSPARDGGSPELTGSLGSSCSRRDAPGTARPLDGDGDGTGRCDVGAVEAIGVSTLDIDGDGQVGALTDGLLILRYLFAFAGNALVNGAIAPGAPRSTPDAVVEYLTAIESLLDIDGDGAVTPLTDGLLILRYMFGLSGDALIAGAIGPGAVRTTAAQVIAYFELIGG